MGPPHEGSIWRPIAPCANALTTVTYIILYYIWALLFMCPHQSSTFDRFCFGHFKTILSLILGLFGFVMGFFFFAGLRGWFYLGGYRICIFIVYVAVLLFVCVCLIERGHSFLIWCLWVLKHYSQSCLSVCVCGGGGGGGEGVSLFKNVKYN